MSERPERRMLSIELPVDLIERLDRLARLHHRSRTGEITQALEDYAKRQEGSSGESSIQPR